MDQLSSQIIVNILRTKMQLPQNNVWLRDQNRKIPNDDGLYISAGIINTSILSCETFLRDGAPSSTWDALGKQFDQGDSFDTTPPTNFDQPDATFDVPGETYVDASPTNYDQDGQMYDQGNDFDQLPQPIPVTEVNRIQAQEFIQIDIFSRANTAIYRNWEIVAALQSGYSQQLQELNNFKIFRVPRGFINTSYAEGGSQLNRYTLTVCCFVWYVKETLLTSGGGDYYDDFTQRVDDHKTIGTDKPLIAFEINQEGIVT